MNYLRRSTRGSPELMVDTNIVFSAILYPSGNAGWPLETASNRQVPVVLVDYIEDELVKVLGKKGVSAGKVRDFLRTYPNIERHDSKDVSLDEIEKVKTSVSDRKDRPLVAYALHRLNLGFDCLLVTGDKKLFVPTVRGMLKGNIKTASEILEMMHVECP